MILLRDLTLRSGAIDSLRIPEIVGAVSEQHPNASVEEITAKTELLLQQTPKIKTPEQRAEFYMHVMALYEHVKNRNSEALEQFVENHFNRPYKDRKFFDGIEVKVLAFGLGYMLNHHGETTRKIRGAKKSMPLYSSHPIEVALNYIDTFERVNAKLSSPEERAVSRSKYKRHQKMRRPYFADVIKLLWHDLPEETMLSLNKIKQDYLSFIEDSIPKRHRKRFLSATDRILTGIEDLTRKGDYFDVASEMLKNGQTRHLDESSKRYPYDLRKRQFVMGKCSDISANAEEMDDIPTSLSAAYNWFRDSIFEVMGYDNVFVQKLRSAKNFFSVAVNDIIHRIDGNTTFSAADRIKRMFQGFVIANAANGYLATGDSDPYLIQLRDRLVKSILDRGEHTEFHLLNYHCRGLSIPPKVSYYNWRIYKLTEQKRSAPGETDRDRNWFLNQYINKPKPRTFDLEAKVYLDSELEKAAADESLFMITKESRGGPFDGLVHKYYSSLIRKDPDGDWREVKREINGNRTLQYMLTIVLVRLAEEYQKNLNFRFVLSNDPKNGSPADYSGKQIQ